MKLYDVKQYKPETWEAIEADCYEEDVITVLWREKAVCLDIIANGKRLVPVLRKIEKSLRAAGLIADGSCTDAQPYGGWFDSWADSLVDPRDRKYFIYSYDGKQDAENGHWSFSWGIEAIDDDRFYIFLNLARDTTAADYVKSRGE